MEGNITLDDLYLIHSKILTLKKKPDRLKSFVTKMVSAVAVKEKQEDWILDNSAVTLINIVEDNLDSFLISIHTPTATSGLKSTTKVMCCRNCIFKDYELILWYRWNPKQIRILKRFMK